MREGKEDKGGYAGGYGAAVQSKESGEKGEHCTFTPNLPLLNDLRSAGGTTSLMRELPRTKSLQQICI